MGDPAIFVGRIILILCYHSTVIDDTSHPCLSLKQCVISRSVYQRNIIGGWFHVIINLQPLIHDKGNVFLPIGGVENASLNRVPWDRGWGVELWISSGVESGYLSKMPSYGPFSRTTVYLLVQWKAYPGTEAQENKTASYERLQCVTWD